MNKIKEIKLLAVLLSVVWLFGSGFGIWVPEKSENLAETEKSSLTNDEFADAIKDTELSGGVLVITDPVSNEKQSWYEEDGLWHKKPSGETTADIQTEVPKTKTIHETLGE